MAPSVALFGMIYDRGFASSDLNVALPLPFMVEPHQVVILPVFYGGANWEDEL